MVRIMVPFYRKIIYVPRRIGIEVAELENGKGEGSNSGPSNLATFPFHYRGVPYNSCGS